MVGINAEKGTNYIELFLKFIEYPQMGRCLKYNYKTWLQGISTYLLNIPSWLGLLVK